MKRFLKQKLLRAIPHLLRRYDLASRARLVWACISPANLVAAESHEQTLDLFIHCARALKIDGYIHAGAWGSFCGAVDDESVMGAYVRTGEWAPALQNLLQRIFIDNPGTYIDVGANIGLTVVPVAKLQNVHCIAVEPEPRNFTLLRINCALNGVENAVRLINSAAVSSHGEVTMQLSPWNFGDHRIRGKSELTKHSSDIQRKHICVQGAPLDSLISADQLRGRVVMKIDTQGAESEVLHGAQSLLRQTDVLVMEFWPFGLAELGANVEELLRLLTVFSYGALLKTDDADRSSVEVTTSAAEILEKALHLSTRAQESEYWDLVLSRFAIRRSAAPLESERCNTTQLVH